MIVTIHQPEHLPWLGYFHKMRRADVFVLLDNVQYRKNYFQNRNRILGANGPFWLTVPVQLKGHLQSEIRDIEVDNSQRWAGKYWKSLLLNYGKHPYFRDYAPALESLFNREWNYLWELNLAIIDVFRAALKIETSLLRASELPVSGRSTDLLFGICQNLGATTYLSGPSGRNYLDETVFLNGGVKVEYHQFSHPVYKQHGRTDFESHLSTIDCLANLGEVSRELT